MIDIPTHSRIRPEAWVDGWMPKTTFTPSCLTLSAMSIIRSSYITYRHYMIHASNTFANVVNTSPQSSTVLSTVPSVDRYCQLVVLSLVLAQLHFLLTLYSTTTHTPPIICRYLPRPSLSLCYTPHHTRCLPSSTNPTRFASVTQRTNS